MRLAKNLDQIKALVLKWTTISEDGMVRLRGSGVGAIGAVHKISVNGWTMAVPCVDQGTSGTPASTVITSPGQSTAGCQKPSDMHGSFNSYRESVIDSWVSRALACAFHLTPSRALLMSWRVNLMFGWGRLYLLYVDLVLQYLSGRPSSSLGRVR